MSSFGSDGVMTTIPESRNCDGGSKSARPSPLRDAVHRSPAFREGWLTIARDARCEDLTHYDPIDTDPIQTCIRHVTDDPGVREFVSIASLQRRGVTFDSQDLHPLHAAALAAVGAEIDRWSMARMKRPTAEGVRP